MQTNYSTKRLTLALICVSDDAFFLKLVNSPSWIQFIGDKNIRTQQEARGYIQTLISNTAVHYWVIRLTDNQTPIGVVTFIKRDDLPHHDIGYALLSEFTRKGYAFEAVKTVLHDVSNDLNRTLILAKTLKENTASIRLLEKFGFTPEKKIVTKHDAALLYSVPADKVLLNHLTTVFFTLFSNANGQVPDWDKLYDLCIPQVLIIKKSVENEEVFTIQSFIEPRKKMLSDGTLTQFREYEKDEDTRVVGQVAQRFSTFQKEGNLNGNYFQGQGNKLFQFVKTGNGWKINAIIWQDDVETS